MVPGQASKGINSGAEGSSIFPSEMSCLTAYCPRFKRYFLRSSAVKKLQRSSRKAPLTVAEQVHVVSLDLGTG